jgi:hypothetical protein
MGASGCWCEETPAEGLERRLLRGGGVRWEPEASWGMSLRVGKGTPRKPAGGAGVAGAGEETFVSYIADGRVVGIRLREGNLDPGRRDRLAF